MVTPPISPVDHSITPAQAADQRFAALEAMVTALGVRMEQLVLPSSSADRVANPTFVPPPPISDIIPSPMITFRNPRFATVLSVESYRLRDRARALLPAQVSGLTTFANQIRPRLSDCVFTGESPLQVLPFLSQLVRVADQSYLSEAILLWIVDDFLRTPAKEAFRAQALDSWPAAVHWFLSTYVPESTLETAVRSMQVSGQRPLESVRAYGNRLQLDSAALGSLMAAPEVKSLFAQGLLDPVKSLFAANQPGHEFEDRTPLSVLVSRAELLETGTRVVPSFPSPRSSIRSHPHRTSVLATPVPVEPPVTVADIPPAVLAVTMGNRRVSSDNWTCFVCYQQGHGWLECPWLAHVSETEKEDALLRRRQYLERFKTPTPTRPTSPFSHNRSFASRPGSPMHHSIGRGERHPASLTHGGTPSLHRDAMQQSPENGRASPQ
jgi:hypothetical protein